MSAPTALNTTYVTVDYTGPKPHKQFIVEIEDTSSLQTLKNMIAVEMNIPLESFMGTN